MAPEQDVPLHLISHTPLVNTDPPPPNTPSLNTLAVPFLQATEVHPHVGRSGVTTPWHCGGWQREEPEGARRLPQRPFNSRVGSGKCFSNLSSATHCLHGAIKDHFGFLPWRREGKKAFLGAGLLYQAVSVSVCACVWGGEGWKLKRYSSTNHPWAASTCRMYYGFHWLQLPVWH